MATARRARAGFTLLEVVISAAILFLLAGTLVGALESMRGLTAASEVRSGLQDAGERALARIVADMRRSGFTPNYPYLFDDGNAVGAFAAHAHAPAAKHAKPGQPDFGPSREIVFLQPADGDGDGIPDIDPTGNLVWDAQEFSYVLTTGADGINRLERRIDAANPRNVASHVERILFEDSASTGFAIPLEALRVTIFLRQRDEKGTVQRHQAEAVVRLRNG